MVETEMEELGHVLYALKKEVYSPAGFWGEKDLFCPDRAGGRFRHRGNDYPGGGGRRRLYSQRPEMLYIRCAGVGLRGGLCRTEAAD